MATNTETPVMTPADIVSAIRSTPMTLADYAEIVRAIMAAIPDLLPPDPSRITNLRSAARFTPKFIEVAADGLKSSAKWQTSADATPEELLTNLDRARDCRELGGECAALASVLKFNQLHHHSIAATKARNAYHNGRTLGGDDGRILKPHLDQLKALFPKTGRPKKPSGTTPETPPATP
jgi:hypothetical protein